MDSEFAEFLALPQEVLIQFLPKIESAVLIKSLYGISDNGRKHLLDSMVSYLGQSYVSLIVDALTYESFPEHDIINARQQIVAIMRQELCR